MAYKHGVYNTEQATSLTVPIQGSAGLQVIFGTAPIHLAKDPAAAVNTPKLVYSYKEAVEAVGYSDDFENFTLCQSISACFQVFNVAPIILVNVLDPNKAAHVTQNQAESCDVVDGVVLYDKKYVLLNTLAVKNGSATLVAGSDYEAAHEDNGSVAITLLSTAAKEASSLTVSSTSLRRDRCRHCGRRGHLHRQGNRPGTDPPDLPHPGHGARLDPGTRLEPHPHCSGSPPGQDREHQRQF